MSLVLFKSPTQDSSSVVDVSSLLPVGETLVSASLLTLSPTTVPALGCSIPAVTGNAVTLELTGGREAISYGIKLRLNLASGLQIDGVVAVLVQSNLNVPFASNAPNAVPALIGEVRTGDAATGSVSFVLASSENPAGAYVIWELISPDGAVVSAGNCYDLVIQRNQFATTVQGTAIVHVPTSAPPSPFDRKYTLRWTLCAPGKPEVYSYEHVAVLGLSSEPLGVQDAVELYGDVASMSITLPELYENVTVDVFSGVGNQRLSGPVVAQSPKRVDSGWYYQVNVMTASMPPSVVPYVVSWKYYRTATPGTSYRETSRLFVLNPSIMNAVEDARSMVNRARATLFNFQDMIFDTQTLISFLRRGMDMFNAAGGIWTSFDMTDATGGIRDYWLGYSEVAMLQAQALAEGEKAFDFQGQAIQLTVDRTQYYNQLAQDTLSRLEANVRPFKQNLQNKGVTGGDGNVNSIKGNSAFVGISIHPASQFGRTWNNWGRIR